MTLVSCNRVFCLLVMLILSIGVQAQETTSGYCSPIIKGFRDGASIKIECNLSAEEAVEKSAASFEEAYRTLSLLRGEQVNYLLPYLHAFSENPSHQKWQLIQKEVRSIENLIANAREALRVYESLLSDERRKEFQSIHGLLAARQIALLYVFENEYSGLQVVKMPADMEAYDEWVRTYSALVANLGTEMDRVIEAFSETEP